MSRIITSWRATLAQERKTSHRRETGEPVVVIVGRDLFLVRAVGLHPPDLHQTGALGIEVNVFSARRIIRAIVQTRASCTSSATGGNGINVKFPVALGTIRKHFAIGQPPRYEAQVSSSDAVCRRKSAAHKRAICVPCLVTDGNFVPSRGNAVVVVALGMATRVERFGVEIFRRNPPAAEEKILHPPRPVGRFECNPAYKPLGR